MKKHSGIKWLAVLVVMVYAVLCGNVFAAEKLTKIADGVYSYVDTKNSTPQNSYGANAGIIIGREGIVVIDTLISAKEARRFIGDIRAISKKPIKYVINTHNHLDHTFGNSEFKKLGAVIISQVKDAEKMKKESEATLKNSRVYGLAEKDMKGTKIVYPELTFTDRMEIDLGGQKVELIYTGSSHTEGSIMIYLPENKILFAGDILFTNYHPYIADGDIESWVKVLDYIMTIDVEKIIPGHGPISSKKDIEDMKNYLIAFDKKAKELAANSNDVAFISTEIKKALPSRAELESLIQSNIQMKYLKK
ncbi:MAG: MBL fold metallo-hydrolase [Nitrospirae bacterium]|nr:MBL fold metallo-hydrolase [Nitrospirota bacterium]MBI3378529.1 MBL fold metallo-hydrolase [Nitrospirota bacterium]